MRRTRGEVSLWSSSYRYSLPEHWASLFFCRSPSVVLSHMLLKHPGYAMRLCAKTSFLDNRRMKRGLERSSGLVVWSMTWKFCPMAKKPRLERKVLIWVVCWMFVFMFDRREFWNIVCFQVVKRCTAVRFPWYCKWDPNFFIYFLGSSFARPSCLFECWHRSSWWSTFCCWLVCG